MNNIFYLNEVERIIYEAGNMFKSKLYNIDKKSDASLVTNVDKSINEFIIININNLFKGLNINIITEESKNNDYVFNNYKFVIDPLDGTTNFVHGYNRSCISVALFEYSRPKYGIVYNPYTNECFKGIVEYGSYLNGMSTSVATQNKLSDSLIAFGSAYNKTDFNISFKIAEKVNRVCSSVRMSGCAALDLCDVACGRTDGYFEIDLKPWDFAAGYIILKTAGGFISDFNTLDDLFYPKPLMVYCMNIYIIL